MTAAQRDGEPDIAPTVDDGRRETQGDPNDQTQPEHRPQMPAGLGERWSDLRRTWLRDGEGEHCVEEEARRSDRGDQSDDQ